MDRTDRRSPWRQFRRTMAWMAGFAAVSIAVALLVLQAQGVVLRFHLVIAIALAIGVSILLAGGLMGLVFASDRGGYDETTIDPDEKGRPGGRP